MEIIPAGMRQTDPPSVYHDGARERSNTARLFGCVCFVYCCVLTGGGQGDAVSPFGGDGDGGRECGGHMAQADPKGESCSIVFFMLPSVTV